MSDKSPQKTSGKKPGKTLKQKRAEKRAAAQADPSAISTRKDK